jgi:hypothetical protein
VEVSGLYIPGEIKKNCIQSMAPQGAEGKDSLLKKKAREAHLELLLFS